MIRFHEKPTREGGKLPLPIARWRGMSVRGVVDAGRHGNRVVLVMDIDGVDIREPVTVSKKQENQCLNRDISWGIVVILLERCHAGRPSLFRRGFQRHVWFYFDRKILGVSNVRITFSSEKYRSKCYYGLV